MSSAFKLISSLSVLLLVIQIWTVSGGVSKYVKNPCYVKKEHGVKGVRYSIYFKIHEYHRIALILYVLTLLKNIPSSI